MALFAATLFVGVPGAAAANVVSIDGSQWTPCAVEYGHCTFTGEHRVLYGTLQKHAVKSFNGSAGCDNGVFDDPAPGASKQCWLESGDARSIASAPAPVPRAPDAPVLPPALAMACSAASASANASTEGDVIEANTPGSDGSRMFPSRRAFNVAITTRATRAQASVKWEIRDSWSAPKASGQFAVTPGAHVYSMTCASRVAGYFSVSAQLDAGSAGSATPAQLP